MLLFLQISSVERFPYSPRQLSVLYAEGASGDGASAARQMRPSDFTVQEVFVTRATGVCMPALRRTDAVAPQGYGTRVLPKGDVFITGGLGGLGLTLSSWLLGAGCSHLVLTSRSGRIARDGQGLQGMLDVLLKSGHRVTVLPNCKFHLVWISLYGTRSLLTSSKNFACQNHSNPS